MCIFCKDYFTCPIPLCMHFCEDILHVCISNEGEVSSVELTPNITAELNENGDLIGIEILNASSANAVMETVQAKMLKLSEAGAA